MYILAWYQACAVRLTELSHSAISEIFPLVWTSAKYLGISIAIGNLDLSYVWMRLLRLSTNIIFHKFPLNCCMMNSWLKWSVLFLHIGFCDQLHYVLLSLTKPGLFSSKVALLNRKWTFLIDFGMRFHMAAQSNKTRLFSQYALCRKVP